MQEKVSLIVPVYNARKYLPQLAAQLCAQTYRNLEILLVDDGSTDGSGAFLDKLERKDPRIHVIRQENRGTAEARNTGMASASGEYLMFLDDDDRVPKTYVQEYAAAIERMPADIVIGGYRRVAEDGRVLFTRRMTRKDMPAVPCRDGSGRADGNAWLKFVQIAPWAKIYRRSFVVKSGARFLPYAYGEDIFFQMQLYAHHPETAFSRSVSYCWVSWEKSVTNTLHKGIKRQADIFPMLDNVLEVYPERDDFFCYFLERHCAYHLLTSGREAEAERLEQEFIKCGRWRKENGCRTALSPFSPLLKGELMKDRVAVFGIRVIGRLHLEGLFARLYAKG